MKRLVDELTPGFELSLLASEAADAPSDRSRTAARRAGLGVLGVELGALAASSAPAGGAVTAKTGAVTAGWKMLAIGVVSGAVAAGGGVLVVSAPEAPVAPRDPASTTTAAPRMVPATPVAPLERAAPPVTGAPGNPTPERAAPGIAAPDTRARTAPEAPDTSPAGSASAAGLAAEVTALDAIRRALDRGDANSALRGLAEYQRDFPRGKLAPEATALRIEALARSGDRSQAKRLAEKLFAEHPSGPYRRRLEKVLETP